MASIELPAWAKVGPRRLAHICRVTALIVQWAEEMRIPSEERECWHDAALFHDCLRDAPIEELREIVHDPSIPDPLLHGPAAAIVLTRDGEKRADLLEAVRWHTVGCRAWGACGRALYMADYLEPGRPFGRVDRDYLAARVPTDFDGTLRQVVRERLEWMLREGFELPAETTEFWNSLR
ncbi:MAG TPA: HD domain-containing protein [Gemmatimonadaceae bacterium]|nr:HD domain-containing protein [Gemmatimonadaceae bacterium]